MDRIKQILKTEKTDKKEIVTMTEAYLKYLTDPMDDMWEIGIIGASNYYKIIIENNEIGYFCLDDQNILLQFFIKDSFQNLSIEIFNHILDQYKIREAYVSTIEPRYLSLCLDAQEQVTVHTLLYKDLNTVNRANPIKESHLNVAEIEALTAILEFHLKNIGSLGAWVEAYYTKLIEKGQLFLLKLEEEIIGTGEFRPSEQQRPYVNLGVITSQRLRRQGIASHILTYLKELAYQQGLIPICSTTVNNIGSRRAIENAGFFAANRVLKITFK